MEVKYALHLNPFTATPDDCRAIVVDTTVYNIEDVVKQITGEGSILKGTECRAVTNEFLKQIGINLANGIAFSCEYFTISFEIQGVFVNNKDKYDPLRHHIYARIIPGKAWKEFIEKVMLVKVEAGNSKPKLETLFDMSTKCTNQTLTSGSMAELKGNYLKIDENANDEGVYFISTDSREEIKASYFHQNFPKTLMFQVPDLAAGSYQLEVRSRGHNCKTLKVGTLGVNLEVA